MPRPNSMKRKNIEYSVQFKIENGKVEDLTSNTSRMLLNGIIDVLNKKTNIYIMCGIMVVGVFVASLFFDILITLLIDAILIPLIVLIGILVNKKNFIVIKFVLNTEAAERYNRTQYAIRELTKSQFIWHIKQTSSVLYSRVNSGASTNVNRERVFIKYANLPNYIKTINISSFYKLSIEGEDYYFLPNCILYIKKQKVAIIDYADLEISLKNSNFRETGISPNDSKLLGYTWLYVNNNGTPDRRFNYNKRIPIYLYTDIYIKSKTGLNLYLMVSNSKSAVNFKNMF